MSEQIGGGGEWTALRELADRAYCDYVDQLRRPECLGYEQKLKQGSFGKAELDAHTRAGELLGRHRAFAEALAAAAPASPANLQVGHDESRGDLCEGNSSGLRTESPSTFAPPPQDGQGAELLGPPSKAEREVATATDGLGVAELRDMLEAACVLAELDEVPAKVTVLRWRAALRGEKKPVPSGNEAVAGNASAPVGETNLFTPEIIELLNKREAEMDAGKFDELAGQPSEVGEGLREAQVFTAQIADYHAYHPLKPESRERLLEAIFKAGDSVNVTIERAALAAPAPKPAPPGEQLETTTGVYLPVARYNELIKAEQDKGFLAEALERVYALPGVRELAVRRAAERKPPR